MPYDYHIPALIVLLALVVYALLPLVRNANRREPTLRPVHFNKDDLPWKEGSGTMKGLPVAVVSENPRTGEQVSFVRIPPNKNEGVEPEYHYHTRSSQTVVLEGSVNSAAGGKAFAVSASDYFRCPANWIHADSGGGGLLFVVVDPDPPDLVSIPVAKAASSGELLNIAPAAEQSHYLPGLFRGHEIAWEKRDRLPELAVAGLESAVVSNNPAAGTISLFVRVPPNSTDHRSGTDHRSEQFSAAASHILVISGDVSAEAGGRTYSLGAGDYFGAPTGWAKARSDAGALLFVITRQQ